MDLELRSGASRWRRIPKLVRGALLLFVLLAVPVQGQTPDDPIARLVQQLNGTGGLWVNGVSPLLEYPATVEPTVLVRKILDGYDWARDRPFEILETRTVTIDHPPGEPFQALLLSTAAGRKIVLLQFSGRDWWSKVFDAP